MRIATWNVNGIRARLAQFRAWMEQTRPDVICLQELKAPVDKIPAEIRELGGYWCYWHGQSAYSGVGLLVSRELAAQRPEFSHPDFDHETRIVAATLGDLVVASIYVPNGGKDFPAKIRFLEALAGFAGVTHATGRPLVLCGDLNVARTDRDVHPKERRPVIGQLPEERELLERIIGQGLVDVGRALDPDNDNLFTWWAPWRNMRARNIGWRLDYLLVSDPVARRATACVVERETGTSDHAPVVADFR